MAQLVSSVTRWLFQPRKAPRAVSSMASPANVHQFLQDSDNRKLSCCLVSCISAEQPINNEAIGLWIQNLAQEILAQHPTVRFYRYSWSTVALIQENCDDWEPKISNSLARLAQANLTSCSVFSLLTESYSNKMDEFQKMELQLAKVNDWKIHAYSYYYKDGRKIELSSNKSHE